MAHESTNSSGPGVGVGTFTEERARRHPGPRLRPPLADPGRAVRLAGHRHRRQHRAQRGAPDAAEGVDRRRPRGEQHPDPVDRRRLRPRVRRPAVHRRRARRPLRPQGRAAGRPRCVFRVGSLIGALADTSGHADLRPGGHGRRRRVRDAVDPVDAHQRVPVRTSGPRRSPSGPASPAAARRSARWRPASSSSTSGGARCSSSTCRSSSSRSSPAGSSCPKSKDPRARRSTRSAPCCRSSGSARSSTPSSRARTTAGSAPSRSLCSASPPSCSWRSCCGSCTTRHPMLDLHLLPEPALRACRRRHHARVLRPVRLVLHADAVLPGRARLLAARRRGCGCCRSRS